MSNYHTTSEGNIPFTAEEEAQRNAEEAQELVRQTALANTKYQRDRAEEYPSINDYYVQQKPPKKKIHQGWRPGNGGLHDCSSTRARQGPCSAK